MGLHVTQDKVVEATALCTDVLAGWRIHLESCVVQGQTLPPEHRSEGVADEADFLVAQNKFHIALGNLAVIFAVRNVGKEPEAKSMLTTAIGYLSHRLDPRDPELAKVYVFERYLAKLEALPLARGLGFVDRLGLAPPSQHLQAARMARRVGLPGYYPTY